MALHLHRAEDTGALAAGLGALLAEPLADPFAAELVLVSARGMERAGSASSCPMCSAPAQRTTACARASSSAPPHRFSRR